MVACRRRCCPVRLDRGVAGWRPGRPRGEGESRKPELNDRRESDSCVVPARLANKAERSAAEPVEGRRLDEGNTASKTRAGRRAGKVARHVRWSVCAESR